jgi:hypothetical protein
MSDSDAPIFHFEKVEGTEVLQNAMTVENRAPENPTSSHYIFGKTENRFEGWWPETTRSLPV